MVAKDSSSSEEDCAHLHSVAVSGADIAVHAQRSAAQAAAKAQGARPGWQAQAIHKLATDASGDGNEDALPEGFQQQLRKALERKLEKNFTVLRSAALERVPDGTTSDSDTGVRLFKRVKLGTAFSASAVNRPGQPAAGAAPGRRTSAGDLDSDAEDIARKRAAATAVEPSELLRGAAQAAAVALLHVEDPTCYSESDEDKGYPGLYQAYGKPPRAPPRGRPKAAAVPGRSLLRI
ncbi:hypothetical protein WJX81_006592 [Elliptochloris bilobata]|uniref:Uncharacterized protein n=1 Tax=Elliptochloris bilobata TaxID=381761 RepID=A0AAW1S8J4_9CHLO